MHGASIGGGGGSPTSAQRSGATLGPSLPLPLIRQRGATSESIIVEQPTNLRLLNQRLTEAALNFTRAHASEPFFVYFAFGHVHTATSNVDPESNPYFGKQCVFLVRSSLWDLCQDSM